MSFKDQVERDISAVFINLDEFAETHNIDGTDVSCVVDGDIIDEKKGAAGMEYDGLFSTEKRLYIKEDFFIQRPIEGERLRLDNDIFTVKKVTANMGMLDIDLRQDST